MIQKISSAIEPQFLCDICSLAVVNPLCPSCLSQEVEAWLTLYPNLRRELLPRLSHFLQRVENKFGESTQCIKCGNKKASICPQCFIENVLKELKRLEANKIILREFFEFFNFDRDHTEYSREAEKLGVI
jgi:hypothetical protein